MSRRTIKNALKNFGLTEKEAEIYVFLAKHGVLTGGEISKQTKIHRPRIYRGETIRNYFLNGVYYVGTKKAWYRHPKIQA